MTVFTSGDGWEPVAWEPAMECVYCGLSVSVFAPGREREVLKAAKDEHRKTCSV